MSVKTKYLAPVLGGIILCNVSHGESLVALTASNQLITFNSSNPGMTAPPVNITGLASGDMLVGIDRRPANNVLYGLTVNNGTGRIYSINTMTGVASLTTTLVADPSDMSPPFPFTMLSGSFFGMDFNPVVDRLRVVTDTGQNLRINLSNGRTQLDTPLAYASGDPNAGTPPMAIASAYTNNFAGSTSTVLYNLDASISSLVTQIPPNNGSLNTVGLLSLSSSIDSAFDISGISGIAYAVLDGLTLSTIDLSNGFVTQIGPINTSSTIVGLAAPAPEPTSFCTVLLGLAGLLVRRRQEQGSKFSG